MPPRPTPELVRRRVRWLALLTVPLVSALAGGAIILHASPGEPRLFVVGALSTGVLSLVLVAFALGKPKPTRGISLIVVAAFLGMLNAPLAALLAGPVAMGMDHVGDLVVAAAIGGVLLSPVSGMIGATFGACWWAALLALRASQARPTHGDPATVAIRLGLGAMGLAVVCGWGIAAAADAGAVRGHDNYFAGGELLITGCLTAMALGGAALVASGVVERWRLKRLVRSASDGEHASFGVIDTLTGLDSHSEVLPITRTGAARRVLYRRVDAKGEGAYRKNREHRTPWALLP